MNSTSTDELIRRINADALRHMNAGQFHVAREQLQRGVEQEPTAIGLWLNLAACHRALSEYNAAHQALDKVLQIAPRAFFALLMKGSLFEREQDIVRAVNLYDAALAVVPPEDRLDESTRTALQHARALHRRVRNQQADAIRSDVMQVRSPGSSAESRRINTFIERSLGLRAAYQQQPTHFNYPGLPSIEYYERDLFPWLDQIEAATPQVRGELQAVLASSSREGFAPYIDYPEGLPLDQWAQLNGSHDWSAFHFYHYGRRYEDNCQRCPQTAALLASIDQPQVPERMPAAMYSVLAPRTRIPAHTGVANVRLVVHLPLIVPPGCGFRVGSETRFWEAGKAWVFDDTIEHEAWNDSDLVRIILIFDIWNPLLSVGERAAITAVMNAMNRHQPANQDQSI